MFRQLQLHIHLCLLNLAPAPASVPRLRLFSLKRPGGKGAHLSPSSSATADGVPRPWFGLHSWRESPLNENRTWGADGPQHSPPDPSSSNATYGSGDPALDAVSSLAEFGALVLSTPDPMAKARVSHVAFARWLRRKVPVGEFRPPDRPARPSKPPLVSMRDVPAPKNSGLPLNAYMLHNLAHVELNAIDLAWDTVVRFSPLREALGEQFFSDFAHVADEESRHFSWCAQRLAELGCR
ncbi:hypothetical protein Taro_001667 [Colocasia esculenta]|uniref:DUF455 family protein n=1 Tax=Colocasia esculenta TaxID=4460 RepID=A0A843TLI9_COLES|nr:hypothetical protein [Colocasia esculenta]